MSSKIESYGAQAPTAPARLRAVDGVAAGSAGRGPVNPVIPADSVKLTDDARLMQQLQQQLAQAPAVDGRRVAETRLALAEGRYEVDAHSVADKLLRMEQELAQR
jgi:negative regulator of flagellin synthesis FlgM